MPHCFSDVLPPGLSLRGQRVYLPVQQIIDIVVGEPPAPPATGKSLGCVRVTSDSVSGPGCWRSPGGNVNSPWQARSCQVPSLHQSSLCVPRDAAWLPEQRPLGFLPQVRMGQRAMSSCVLLPAPPPAYKSLIQRYCGYRATIYLHSEILNLVGVGGDDYLMLFFLF